MEVDVKIRSKTGARLAAIGLLLLLSSTGQVFAHAKLVSASPAQDQMAMPPPTELRLKFSEAVEPKFTKVKVTGPDGKVVKTGAVKVDPADKTTIIVPLSGPLPDGKYTVDWQAVSADTHKVKGTYSFQSMK
jgi:methionine-rich copper-binding protein CopC